MADNDAPLPLIVIVRWPAEPDRGQEVYGPFDDEEAQIDWTDKCIHAQKHGSLQLKGAEYVCTRMDKPFDPFNFINEKNEA